MISDEDVEKLAAAARMLLPNASTYLEEDFVMNLLETALDYMLQTEVVVRALERFRENRWNDFTLYSATPNACVRQGLRIKGATDSGRHISEIGHASTTRPGLAGTSFAIASASSRPSHSTT
jgi:hypothetical protein